MSKEKLLRDLRNFIPCNALEQEMLERIVAFVSNHERYLDRHYTPGHVTGSAWIVDQSRQYALLTHHGKLNTWLQLGGHAEGETEVSLVALREAQEESGLQSVRLLSDAVFSVDVHPIPARGDFPMHYHYDIRYLLEADRNEPLLVSEESHDVKWIPLDAIQEYNADDSVGRMVVRSRALFG